MRALLNAFIKFWLSHSGCFATFRLKEMLADEAFSLPRSRKPPTSFCEINNFFRDAGLPR